MKDDPELRSKADAILKATKEAYGFVPVYCVKVQAQHAIAAGATRDEVLEAMTIGSYMAMTRAQSYAFRKYAELFDVELDG